MFDSQDTKCKLRKPQWKVPVQDFSHHPKKDVIYPVPLPQWATFVSFHRIAGKAECINNDCGCFCYYSSASWIIIFSYKKKKKPLSYPLKESQTKLCLGFVKQCVMVTFSEFSL